MNETDISPVRQELIPLYEWGTTVPVIWFEGKAHYPLRMLCDILGVKAQMQLERLREHAVLQRLLRQLPVRTRTGTRETWCIERRGIGFWLGSIQIASIRADIQPRLLEFQEALVDAADRLLSGEVSSVTDVARFTLALEVRIGRLEERALGEDDNA
jgi:P22_AR N-terminal domain